MESLHGRELVYVVDTPGDRGGRWVVRHYRRGGAVARVLGDRYLRVGVPRPFRERDLSDALREAGIRTPPVVGAAVYPAGPFYRGDLVTELVPGARDLAAVLFGVAQLPSAPRMSGDGAEEREAAAAMRAAGRLVRALHELGVVHRDLNLKNILLTRTPEGGLDAWILDLDAARLRTGVSAGARRRMLKRFWRSAAKWESRTDQRLPSSARSSFEAGYHESDLVV